MADKGLSSKISSEKMFIPSRYMPQLDSLRALAALGVFAQHFVPMGSFFQSTLPLGDLGVRMFFVLSGFLITMVILNSRDNIEQGIVTARAAIGRFYMRRFLRLMPVYFVFLTLALVLIPEMRQNAWWFYTYLQNVHYLIEGNFTFADPVWTLAVEEQFYLIWPFLILFFSRVWMLPAVITVAALGIISRIAFLSIGFTHFQASMLTPSHFDTLGIGALLAVLGNVSNQPLGTIKNLSNYALVLGSLLLGTVLVSKILGMTSNVEFILGEIGSGLLFVWVIGTAARGFNGPIGFVLNQPVLMYLGKISYGMYVYHWFVPAIVKNTFPEFALSFLQNGFAQFVFYSLLSIGLAIISWHVMEQPILGLKRFFSNNRA